MLSELKSKFQSAIAVLLGFLLDQWMRLAPTLRTLIVHIWRAIMNFKNHGMRQAAALSYYAVFSVFPLTLLLAVIVSEILGPTVAVQQVADGLRLFLPNESDSIDLFLGSIEQALEQSRSFGLIALVGAIWSALGLFSNLTASLDIIFQVPSSRSMWQQRLLAFLMTSILIILVLTSFITSGVLMLIDALLLSNPSVWITISTYFLPFGLNVVIFVLLFRYVPSRHVNWDAVWPAAIFGGLGLELAKWLFALYLTNFPSFQIVYGGIATVIVLLLWAYLMMCIFLISAELCSQLNFWLSYQNEPPLTRIFSDQKSPALPSEIPPPV